MVTLESIFEILIDPVTLFAWLLSIVSPLVIAKIATPKLLFIVGLRQVLLGIALAGLAGGFAFTVSMGFHWLPFLIGTIMSMGLAGLFIFPLLILLARLKLVTIPWFIGSLAVLLLGIVVASEWMQRDIFNPVLRTVDALPWIVGTACVLGGAFAIGAQLPWRRKP